MGEMTWKYNTLYVENVILREAVESNILPVTSTCNMQCVFCSHLQNPPEVEVWRIAPRSPSEIERTLSFMDRGRPVVIGESASRILEGEPFTHPEIKEILKLVRRRLPDATIKITTNGSLLDEETAGFLSGLGNVEVCLSMNSAGRTARALLMGDTGDCAVKSPVWLKNCGVPFHGSVVAMPHLVGWADLEETVAHLCFCGAETVRLMLPGYSRLAPPALRFEPALWEELGEFADSLRSKTDVPLTCEPPLIKDLKARVTGVISGSPAARAGIRRGDVIETVNGSNATTRVEAFNLVLKAASPDVIVRRNGETMKFGIDKKAGERSGLVMDYDLDPGMIGAMAGAVQRRGVDRVLVMTSELARSVVTMGLQEFWEGGAEVEVAAVRNRFFGGSVKAAGLLTVEDFAAAADEYFALDRAGCPRLVLLPGMAFDFRGRDLAGRHYTELEEKHGIPFLVL